MHFTYVIRQKNGKWYIGHTNNLERRLSEHQRERECSLIYYEAYKAEKAAKNRERKLKYYGSAWRALKKRIAA